MNWILQYKLATSMQREELVRRLKNVTVLKGERAFFRSTREKMLFFGKVDEHRFLLRINPIRMSNLDQNSFLPVVRGEITKHEKGGWIISFALREDWPGSMGVVVLVCIEVCCLAREPICAVAAALVWCLCHFLKRQYWKSVGRRLMKWFIELWDGEEIL